MDTVTTLSVAMQQEMQRVLMEGPIGLTSEKLDRLEALARSAREFLKAASPREYVLAHDLVAEKIQAERFRQLGFTPEMQNFSRTFNQRQNAEAAEALKRLAEVHGVGEDDDDADEEVEVEVVPVPGGQHEIWLSIGLIDRVIQVLAGSDGDVADHLIGIVNDCRVRHGDVQPDAIVPLNIGIVHLVAAGLNDAEVLKAHPEAELLANEISSCVLSAASRLNQETVPETEARA